MSAPRLDIKIERARRRMHTAMIEYATLVEQRDGCTAIYLRPEHIKHDRDRNAA